MPGTLPASKIDHDGQNTGADKVDESSTLDLITMIRYATGLGWAMTELLGRCIILRRILEAAPPQKPDFNAQIVILSPIRDRRERALSVMGRILFLAKCLGVANCQIEEQVTNYSYERPEHARKYLEVLKAYVAKLCSVDTQAGEYKQICASINSLLYYWNEQIQVILQEQPPSVYNGYTVGRGFATIRWFIGIGETGEVDHTYQSRSNALISEASLFKLLDHLQTMSIFLQPLVPQALQNSLLIWGRAIIKNPEALSEETQVTDKHKNMKRALIKQATIWHDLLTGERDPTTFVSVQVIVQQFTGRLMLFILPFLLGGLLVAVAVFAVLAYLQGHLGQSMQTMTNTSHLTSSQVMTQSITDTIQNTVTALIAVTATIPLIRTWIVSSTRTATDFVSKHPNTVSTAGKNALDLLWQQSQQVAVNKKTLVSPHSNPPDVDDGD